MSALIPPAIRYLGSKFLCAETYEAAGWRREDRQALTQRGMATESIWISPRIQSLSVQERLL